MKKMGKEQLADILKGVLPSNECISEAPDSLPDFLVKASRETVVEWVKKERKKRYKAIDSVGNVYKVVNPLVWPMNQAGNTVRRPLPEFIYSSKDATSGSFSNEEKPW